MNQQIYSQKKSKLPWTLGLSALCLVGLGFFLIRNSSTQVNLNEHKDFIRVYCAAGIRMPIQEIAKQYEREYGVEVKLEYGSSGELEGKLELDSGQNKNRADLYIPADAFFAKRAANKGLLAESIPLAEFRLILAVKADSSLGITSVDDLLKQKIPFAICNKEAGAGKKTYQALKKAGVWEQLNHRWKVEFPRVTETANALKTSGDIQAAFMWNTTAKQFALKILNLPELADATSTISVNVVRGGLKITEALRFARYMSSPEKGSQKFSVHHFTPSNGDTWSEVPELLVYCGGLNRDAVEGTLEDFRQREGVILKTEFAGCGSLVASMKGIRSGEKSSFFPDAYMTCDKSFYDKVQSEFGQGQDISRTRIVILVRKGNPKNIRSLKDLAKPGVKIGTTDKRTSTLGYLSWKMFKEEDIEELLIQQNNVVVMAPTAHELIAQIISHPKLDAVLVYEANCNHAKYEYELIEIDHPLALAQQNIGVSKSSTYPLLTGRLIDALMSSRSKKRFENYGFNWNVKSNGGLKIK